jgi:PAS domain-containing protein
MHTHNVDSENGAPRQSHLVQFYEQDGFLVEAVGRFLGESLLVGGSAIVIATAEHRQAIAGELALRGIDIPSAESQGRYVALDAAETLTRFMVEGRADGDKFREAISPIVRSAQAASGEKAGVAAFGEMVALLWSEGKRDAALELERLWNELSKEHSFSLLCGYPIGAFDNEEHRRLFHSICGEHSHVVPAEDYPASGSERQRRRAMARLQRDNQALKAEVELGRQRVQLVQKMSGCGSWELDFVDDELSVSSRAAALLGLESGGRIKLSELLDLLYFSADRENLRKALEKARTGRKEFVTECRIRCKGQPRLVSLRGKTVYNSGQPFILGVVSDITPVAA